MKKIIALALLALALAGGVTVTTSSESFAGGKQRCTTSC
jgi:hypothetical protein